MVLWYWISTMVWAAFIGVVSLGASVPADSFFGRYYGDKVFHFLSYTVLSFMIARATITTWNIQHRATKVFLPVAMSVVYGAVLELLQGFIPARDASLGDIIANALGAYCGTQGYARYAKRLAEGEGRETD